MEVEYGTLRDIDSWMELVKEVRWNFPGLETEEALEDHRQTVLRFMGENRALCMKNGDKVIGVLLFSKTHNNNHPVCYDFNRGHSCRSWFLLNLN